MSKTKKPGDILEDDIEGYLVSSIEALGGECLKLRPPRGRGFPDRTCKIPGRDTFYVETKRPVGGVITKQQKEWAKRLRAAGSLVLFVSTRAEVDTILRAVLAGPHTVDARVK